MFKTNVTCASFCPAILLTCAVALNIDVSVPTERYWIVTKLFST